MTESGWLSSWAAAWAVLIAPSSRAWAIACSWARAFCAAIAARRWGIALDRLKEAVRAEPMDGDLVGVEQAASVLGDRGEEVVQVERGAERARHVEQGGLARGRAPLGPDQPGVAHGGRGVGAERLGDAQVGGREGAPLGEVGVEHADDLFLAAQRRAQYGPVAGRLGLRGGVWRVLQILDGDGAPLAQDRVGHAARAHFLGSVLPVRLAGLEGGEAASVRAAGGAEEHAGRGGPEERLGGGEDAGEDAVELGLGCDQERDVVQGVDGAVARTTHGAKVSSKWC